MQGRVFSNKNEPIPGATVSLYTSKNVETYGFENLVTAVATDASGLYEIKLYSSLKGFLTASKLGYANSESKSSLALEAPGFFRSDFVLKEAGSMVRGRVTDLKNAPVQGAKVVMGFSEIVNPAKADRPSQLVATTDLQGRYMISPVPEGKFGIYVSSDEFETGEKGVEIAGAGTYVVDFNLAKANVILMRLRVVDSSGRPIQLAAIAWAKGEGAFSDGDGIAKMRLDAAVAYQPITCRIAANGYVPRTVSIDPSRSRPEVMLEKAVVFEKASALLGNVVSPEGSPIDCRGKRRSGRGSGQNTAGPTVRATFPFPLQSRPRSGLRSPCRAMPPTILCSIPTILLSP